MATARSTGGVGFDFEDHVAAYLLAQALGGADLLGLPGARLELLQMQVRADGWRLDDLVLTASVGSNVRRLSVSCKADAQVSAAGLPEEFLRIAWAQWLGKNGPMSRTTDRMMLATGIQHPGFDELWRDIKTWGGEDEAEAALAIARMRETKKHGGFFDRVKQVGASLQAGIDDEEVLRALRAMEQKSFDFHLPNSSSVELATMRCGSLLLPGESTRASELWDDLVGQCRRTRLGSGTLPIDAVWRQLTKKFDLKDRADIAADWQFLRQLHNEQLALVETRMSGGHQVERARLRESLRKAIESQIVVVFGESGSGKSALVKNSLDALQDTEVLWLSPDDVGSLLSAAGRRTLGVKASFLDLLRGTTKAKGILVLDSAERLSEQTASAAAELVRGLINADAAADTRVWQVIVVAQREAFDVQGLREALSVGTAALVEVGPLTQDEVKAVLRSSPQLSWLAAHADATAALTNLRTLAWLLTSPTAVGSPTSTKGTWSKPRVIEAIWDKWIAGRMGLHRLLATLAEKEAQTFSRGIPISDISAADLTSFDSRPAEFPMRSSGGRLHFVHDLAGDWSRYMRLREVVRAPEALAAFALQPTWSAAIRLFGQDLLRQSEAQATSWDLMFRSLERGGTPGCNAATDLLLDSLYLDAEALQFFDERADFLLEDNGRRLNRLLHRFLHLASAPISGLAFKDDGLQLHLEASYRAPNQLMWPPVAAFLDSHSERVGELISSVVARTCSAWLINTPALMQDGKQYPLRAKFASVALLTARALQADLLKGTIYVDGDERPIYEAVLAAAPDSPEQVAAWALECAGRRDPDPTILKVVSDHRSRELRAHESRLASDPLLRAKEQQRRSRLRSAAMFSHRERLPAWPLGPKHWGDREFRKICATTAALAPLMRVVPHAATEVFLASVIESEPEASDRNSWRDDSLGLEYGQVYPTAYWKSPLYSYLGADEDSALGCLEQLVNFCSQRESTQRTNRTDEREATTRLTWPDGSSREYSGGARVMNWSLTSSHYSGVMFCALAAFEKWLFDRVAAGIDVAPQVKRVLERTESVAIVGVLVNLGKHAPELFNECLAPLLTSPELFLLDARRVSEVPGNFDAISWVREGEIVFELAKAWYMQPSRARTMLDCVLEQMRGNDKFAARVKIAALAWAVPESAIAALRIQELRALLDLTNYQSDGSDPPQWRFVAPQDLRSQLQGHTDGEPHTEDPALLVYRCRSVLGSEGELTQSSAEYLAGVVTSVEPESDSTADGLRVVAAACTLLCLGGGWLAARVDVAKAVEEHVQAAAQRVIDEEIAGSGRRFGFDSKETIFLAHAALSMLTRYGPQHAPTQQVVLAVITQSDKAGGRAFFQRAWALRDHLGTPRWNRLNQLAVLWSALLPLKPRNGVAGGHSWARWFERFLLLPLDDNVATTYLDLPAVAKRMNRLDRRRTEREQPDDLYGPRRWHPNHLNSEVLENTFCWFLKGGGEQAGLMPEVVSSGFPILKRLLAYECWRYTVQTTHREIEDEGEPRSEEALRFKRRRSRDYLPSSLGYAVLHTAGEWLPSLSRAEARELWEGLLELGPGASRLIGHFIDSFFLSFARGDAQQQQPGEIWIDMIRFSLDGWADGVGEYDTEAALRKVLGTEQSSTLERITAIAQIVSSAATLYDVWAERHLKADGDNIGAYCHFAASRAGSPLRIGALLHLNEALSEERRAGSWRSEKETSGALLELLNVCLREHLSQLRSDSQARMSFLSLVGFLVNRQVAAAMVLQERALRELTGSAR